MLIKPLVKKIYPLGWAFAIIAGWQLAAAGITNPTFADTDGDGLPDGWELKTFILEKQKKDRPPCLSMKMPRKDNSSFTGEATTVFAGEPGFYRISVGYLDESDGISKAKLLVNGQVRHVWNFDGTFADCWREEVVENVELKPGDKITIWGRDNPSEYCRIASCTVTPSPTPPTAAQIAELRTPPEIVSWQPGPLAVLAAQRDMSGTARQPQYSPNIISGGIRFLSRGNEKVSFTITFRQAPKTPAYSLIYYGSDGSGLDKGSLLLENQPLTPGAGGETTLVATTGEAGLYGLEVKAGNFSLETDVPHVFPAPVGNRPHQLLRANGTFYFFVPAGVKAFGIGAFPNGGYIGEVTIRTPDGELVTRMDVPAGAPAGVPVRVRPGQDGQVWSVGIEGVSPTIRMYGIPPYLATHPRHLLAPK